MAWRPRRLTALFALILSAICVQPIQASTAAQDETVVILNDPGGSVSERARFIREVKRKNTPIRIEGWRCHSSCTMLAFLPQTCIDPTTTFGFHGPFIDRRKMTEKEFDEWSRFMAQFYPPDFRRWFLQKARYAKRYELMRVSGKELIRFGARACPDAAQNVAGVSTKSRKN